ncbi:MAG TPA: FAD-dependent oxidoreductase [Acidimicrobiales bacterium]|nr:FAD-dependent oxidoreductase [Acidimicrobiales bacterium]
MNRIVIVGAGAAGYAVAEGLHQNGFAGRLTIVGAESEAPYDRPPLSKEILSGAWEVPRAELIAHRRIAPMEPEIRSGIAAESLDTANHSVMLTDGSRLEYDALVVATGITPRQLPHPDAPTIHVLRTLSDSLGLRAAITAQDHARLVVVGAGFLGLEVAATARGLGAEVDVVEPVPGPPLASRIGDVAADKLLALHESRGVRIHTGIGVETIDATRVIRADGVTHDADVILIAVGSTPATEWLNGSGLEIGNGLICDEYCHAGHDVWGAGDVASWMHLGYGQRMRLEHRTNAQEQGHAVAKNILGANEPFTPVPYFWTDQYDARVQLAGVMPPNAEVAVVEGDVDSDQFVQTYSVAGNVAGVLAWKAPRLLAQYRRDLTPIRLN